MDPDGDFVQMIDVDEQARTVVMNKGTVFKDQRIPERWRFLPPVMRTKMKKNDEYEDDEDDEDEDDDEELSPAVEKAMTVAGVVLAVIIVLIVLLLVSKAPGTGQRNMIPHLLTANRQNRRRMRIRNQKHGNSSIS